MKMNYPLKSKPKHEHRLRIILVIGLFLSLSLLAFILPNFTRSVLYTISRPLWLMSDSVSESFLGIKGYFSFKNALIKRNSALEEELASLKLKETDYDFISAEIADLKTELGRSGSMSRIYSQVLSKPPRSPYDTLVIDQGITEGISVGNKVYLSGNIVSGVGSWVTAHTSLVELFSSGNQKQEVVLSRTGVSFELKGRGGANFQLEVPKDTDIAIGDVFEYPGISSSIIGSVYHIDSGSQSSFKIIYVRIPVNVFSAKSVYVEKNP